MLVIHRHPRTHRQQAVAQRRPHVVGATGLEAIQLYSINTPLEEFCNLDSQVVCNSG